MRRLLPGIIFLFVAQAVSAAAWEAFSYDGRSFVRGGGRPTVSVRDGYLPVTGNGELQREDQLPDGTGAVALLCFQERSGGKLRPQRGVAPVPGMAVTLTSASVTVAGRTDAGGYLVLALPPGTYQVRWLGWSKSVKVEKGKTALLALRGGKRMVD